MVPTPRNYAFPPNIYAVDAQDFEVVGRFSPRTLEHLREHRTPGKSIVFGGSAGLNEPSGHRSRQVPARWESWLFRGIGSAQAELGTVDEYGRQTSAPEPIVPKADLAAKYDIKGDTPATSLTIPGDMPDSVAQGMYDAAILVDQTRETTQPTDGGLNTSCSIPCRKVSTPDTWNSHSVSFSKIPGTPSAPPAGALSSACAVRKSAGQEANARQG
jgi:hypothetical protein